MTCRLAVAFVVLAACHSHEPASTVDATPAGPRCDTTQDFVVDLPTELQPNFGMVSISGDNLTALSIAMAANSGAPDAGDALMLSTRASTSEPFPAGTPLDVVNTTSGGVGAAAITADGLELYYAPFQGIYMSQRASTSDTFGVGTSVVGAANAEARQLVLTEKHLFYFDGGWYSAPLAADGTVSAAPSSTLGPEQGRWMFSYDERESYTEQTACGSCGDGDEIYRNGSEGTGVFIVPTWGERAISPDDCDFYYESGGTSHVLLVVSRPSL